MMFSGTNSLGRVGCVAFSGQIGVACSRGTRQLTSLKAILKLMRPEQYYKNLILYVGVVFGSKANVFSVWPVVTLGFVVFCMSSSVLYMINDIVDLESDKNHPRKRLRPLPSGALRVRQALILVGALGIAVVALSKLMPVNFLFMVIAFFTTGLLYSTVFKHIVVLDVVILSLGYVWRAVAGCYAADVSASAWLIILALELALLLALGKRKAEIFSMKGSGARFKAVLASYSDQSLYLLLPISATLVAVSYVMYVLEVSKGKLLATIPVAIYLVYKYVMMALESRIESPETLVFNKGIVGGVIVWIALVFLLLYTNLLELIGFK